MSRLTPTLLPLDKGLNLQTAKILAPQGSVLDSLNYEQVDFQGQKRIDGYARYDGSVLPAFDDFILVDVDTTTDARGIMYTAGGEAFAQYLYDYTADDTTYRLGAVFDENALPEDAVWGKDVITSVEDHYDEVLTAWASMRVIVESLPGPIIGLHWFRDRLYAVADLQQVEVVEASPITITGDLPDWITFNEYNASLTINNAVGDCTLEEIGGDDLPTGATFTIVGDTINIFFPANSYSGDDEIVLEFLVQDSLGRTANYTGTITVTVAPEISEFFKTSLYTGSTSGVDIPTTDFGSPGNGVSFLRKLTFPAYLGMIGDYSGTVAPWSAVAAIPPSSDFTYSSSQLDINVANVMNVDAASHVCYSLSGISKRMRFASWVGTGSTQTIPLDFSGTRGHFLAYTFSGGGGGGGLTSIDAKTDSPHKFNLVDNDIQISGSNNSNGTTFNVLAFVHDPELGIYCDSFNGIAGTISVDLGFRPQWLLLSYGASGGSTAIVDFIRNKYITTNGNTAETTLTNFTATDTGFTVNWGSSQVVYFVAVQESE